MRRRLVLLIMVLICCRSVTAQQRLPGGRSYVATLKTSDGAEIRLRRWTVADEHARRVLVIPELGFSSRLVEPLCVALRDAGFDVATFDGRELTGKRGKSEGLDAWTIDAGRALSVHGPKPLVVALGVGGSVVWDLASLDAVGGVLAINVPQRFELGNAALRQAMAEQQFNPAAWLDSKYGAVLFTGTQRPASTVLANLARLTFPVSPALRADVARLYAEQRQMAVPAKIPLAVVLSSSGNIVPTETALLPSTPALVASRRLGRMETFRRNYGHLDWLVEEDAFEEVMPTIVSALEAMP